MRVGSLFAGVGGFDIAAERAGMEVAWQSEVDQHASEVLDHHWPNTNLGDIHDIRTPPAVDVLCGGFPCQDYSVAGNRAGLAGDRGALWWEYHRLIAEGRPRWVVAENVPGLLSSRDGRDFGTIIDSLTELGYGVVWAVLDAQYFGVAQRRRRMFIVGHSGGRPQPEILALSEGVSGYPQPSRETGEVVAPITASSAGGGGGADAPDAQPGHLIPTGSYGDGTITGAITTTFGPKNYSNVQEVSAGSLVAFTQNQRNEVRDLGGVAGALAAEPGMKQQTYLVVPERGQGADLTGRKMGPTEPAPTLSAINAKDRGLFLVDSAVRRLTPTECERLQGFPDNWTNVRSMSDFQRYKQMGNAVAVPVVEWIMRRIAAQ